jgi:hypothetical protein
MNNAAESSARDAPKYFRRRRKTTPPQFKP